METQNTNQPSQPKPNVQANMNGSAQPKNPLMAKGVFLVIVVVVLLAFLGVKKGLLPSGTQNKTLSQLQQGATLKFSEASTTQPTNFISQSTQVKTFLDMQGQMPTAEKLTYSDGKPGFLFTYTSADTTASALEKTQEQNAVAQGWKVLHSEANNSAAILEAEQSITGTIQGVQYSSTYKAQVTYENAEGNKTSVIVKYVVVTEKVD